MKFVENYAIQVLGPQSYFDVFNRSAFVIIPVIFPFSVTNTAAET